jgi:enamine deaminase RidA (YjgF/YER057c/UK114 family)
MPVKPSYRASLCTALLFVSASAVRAQASGPEFINPPGLTRPTGYTAAHPPANTLIPVTALARPDLLLEIEAVVDLPQGRQR